MASGVASNNSSGERRRLPQGKGQDNTAKEMEGLLEKFRADMRHQMQRDFETALNDVKASLREQVAADLKVTLRNEMKAALRGWSSHFQGTIAGGIREIFKEEFALTRNHTSRLDDEEEEEDQLERKSSGLPLGIVKPFGHMKVKDAPPERMGHRKSAMLAERAKPNSTGNKRADPMQAALQLQAELAQLRSAGMEEEFAPEAEKVEVFAPEAEKEEVFAPEAEKAEVVGEDGSTAEASRSTETDNEANIETNSRAPLLGGERRNQRTTIRYNLPEKEELEMIVNPEAVQEDPPAPLTLSAVISSEPFEIAIAILIFMNAAAIGISTEAMSRDPTIVESVMFQAVDMVFLFFFAVETILRLWVYGWRYFTDDNAAWNIFDFSVLCLQAADTMTQVMPGSVMSLRSLRAVRSLKMIRVLRLLRVFRLVRFIQEMRTIFSMIVTSMRSLFGTVMLLTLVLYLFGICFTQVIIDIRASHPVAYETDPILSDLFGTLGRTILCLYQSITGGFQWSSAISSLDRLELNGLSALFCAYIFFCVFALMNVVTGALVSQAMEASIAEQDAVLVKNVSLLFQKGKLTTGDMTFQEFEGIIKLPEAVDVFKSINVDAAEAGGLFRLIDTQAHGIVDFVEFVNGCLRLRGPAKSLELAIFMHDFMETRIWLKRHILHLEERVKLLADRQLDGQSQVRSTQSSPTGPTEPPENLREGTDPVVGA
eukprot:TRINITY_DN12597_c0_g1_i1.p1 TRINITY_DN12597_c0_g1~~TRINITY_DN12597_c0_g1_i1.p1  ORF type:complete len:712 (+),score=152.59 TRINITY_DN12597_c0_g1_i1:121-2256(+)